MMDKGSEGRNVSGHTWAATFTGIGTFAIALLGFWGIATWSELFPTQEIENNPQVQDVEDENEQEQESLNSSTDTTDTSYFFFEQGVKYYESKDFDSAIIAFDRAIQINPENADFYYYRARALRGKLGSPIYETGKDTKKILEDYSQAILLNDYHKDALWGRAYMYELVYEDFELAIADYSRLIVIAPVFSDEDLILDGALLSRGILYSRTNNYELAISDFERYLTLDNPLAKEPAEIALKELRIELEESRNN